MTQLLSQPLLFEKIGYKPHVGQQLIHQDTRRFQVVAAGRRFGKSEVGGHRLVTEAFLAYYMRNELEEKGIQRRHWIVGPQYSDAEKEFRVLYNELSRLQVPFDKPGTYYDAIGGNMHVSLWGGKFQVHAKSAAHPESLVGEGLHGAIMAEAAKIKERVWTKYVRPTLNDFTGWALMTSTPEGKNWMYDAFMQGQDPQQTAWGSWRMPSWMNPFVYPGGATDEQIAQVRELERMGLATEKNIRATGIDPEVGQLILDLSETVFKQEIAAEFTEFVGRVFQDFDDEVHVQSLEFNRDWLTFGAVDYGFTNPNVWLLIQVDPFGERIHILDELYETGLSPEDFANEIMRRELHRNVQTFYPDPASPGDTRVLENKLRIRHSGGTGGEVNHRLDLIRKALRPFPAHDPKRGPQLLINRRCTNVIREFNDYRYPETRDEQNKNAPEKPMKRDDHTPEALGRFFAGYFGTLPKQNRRSRVRTATMRG